MAKNISKIVIRRLRSSYITTIVSVSLVLFMLGLMGVLIINARRLSNYVRENIGFTVVLKDNTKDIQIRQLQKDLDASAFVKSTEYITKEKAAEELQEELGEDFINSLGYNPLPASINVKLYADYANIDSLQKIEKKLIAFDSIKEVYYQESLVHLVNDNVKKISAIILVFSILLLFISIALINNTIRLSVYSKRFTINTMQLVGATPAFIRKPFLQRSAMHGMLGAFIAIIFLIGVVYFLMKELNELISIQNIGFLFIMIVVLGIIISAGSTYFAVNKYLRLRTGDLYF